MGFKNWWHRLLKGREAKTAVDVQKDITAIIEELRELPRDAPVLIKELETLQELEKEREVASSEVLAVNLETQAEVLDRILQKYESLQDDIDINGIRVKEIAGEFLRRAKKAGLKDLVEKKNKDMKWRAGW